MIIGGVSILCEDGLPYMLERKIWTYNMGHWSNHYKIEKPIKFNRVNQKNCTVQLSGR